MPLLAPLLGNECDDNPVGPRTTTFDVTVETLGGYAVWSTPYTLAGGTWHVELTLLTPLQDTYRAYLAWESTPWRYLFFRVGNHSGHDPNFIRVIDTFDLGCCNTPPSERLVLTVEPEYPGPRLSRLRVRRVSAPMPDPWGSFPFEL
jgi:hypothetical protein